MFLLLGPLKSDYCYSVIGNLGDRFTEKKIVEQMMNPASFDESS
jgi:hypothetical protein